LLAADFQPFHHNRFDAEDVNDDGLVSPMDALMVINAINQRSQRDDLNFIDVNNDGLLSPQDALFVINRLNRGEHESRRHAPPQDESVPSLPDEVRSIDGTNNNLENPELGSAGEELLRIADADYSDGIPTPAGEDRPSAREISNVLSTADIEGTRSDRGLSAFIYVWGQFLDHDIDLTSDQAWVVNHSTLKYLLAIHNLTPLQRAQLRFHLFDRNLLRIREIRLTIRVSK
jgi:peroxidase